MPPRTPRSLLPRYEFGPKPKRRTEFGLLLFGSLLVVALYVIAALGQTSKIPDDLGPFLGVILGLGLVAHMANRWLAPDSNAVVLPLAALLNGIGYVIITRWETLAVKDPSGVLVMPYRGEAQNQAFWTLIGVALYVLTLLVVRHSRDLERYRYLLLLLAGALLVSPLFFSPINGARLWVHVGSFSFQPIEFSKILLCIFFASYFAENKELLSIPTAQIGNRLFLDPRPLIPILVAWGAAMAVIGLEDDIGFAALLFVLFIGLLWVSTGRLGYLLLGLVLFGVGAWVVAHSFSQVHFRVEEWVDPWKNQNTGGYQLSQGWFSMGSGGVGGTGLGFDSGAAQVPFLTSDMIFAAIATEVGMIGAGAVVFAFVLLVGAGFRVAQTARSDFSRLMATGLTLILGFQAFVIMAGVTRLLPFTGVTLPFVAYGGSSLLANYVLIALLIRISDEGSKAQQTMLAAGDAAAPGERPMIPTRR